ELAREAAGRGAPVSLDACPRPRVEPGLDPTRDGPGDRRVSRLVARDPSKRRAERGIVGALGLAEGEERGERLAHAAFDRILARRGLEPGEHGGAGGCSGGLGAVRTGEPREGASMATLVARGAARGADELERRPERRELLRKPQEGADARLLLVRDRRE